ncbi:MAG TPA: four helix bundle protein [Phycisphaerales bacterium]|nr:four helix bundle protein [Phycisphaerales bacterium]
MTTKARKSIRSHRELEVYTLAFDAAMEIYGATRAFPDDERFGLTSQIRRSSRSVCANLAEAWRKRRYPAAFVSKLCDAEGEAAETQAHLEFCIACKYLDRTAARRLYAAYNSILAIIVSMSHNADDWIIRKRQVS